MIDQQKLTDLRALAQAATPGPWVAEEECVVQPWPDHISPLGLTEGASILVAECGGVAFDSPRPNDAAFIAAANPATVLALIDEIERLRAYEDSLRAIVRGINAKRSQGSSEIGLGGAYLAVVELLADNDRLRKRNAKLERVLAEAEYVRKAYEIDQDGSQCAEDFCAAIDAAKEATDG